jgi:myo-inositol-1(or 4)-monophosphatase
MESFNLPEGALEIALQAAEDAGRLQLELLEKGFDVESKSSVVDMVTEADKKSEALIVKYITSHFPDHDILGEEGASRVSTSPWRWIIDPLDGTTNYVHHHPVFCVSIALAWKDEPVLGIVNVPRLGDLYSAVRGEGACRNGKPLAVSTRCSLDEALLASGVPYDRAESRENNISYITALTPRVRGLRRLGAAAYDLCLVAEGVYDGYFELKLWPWDLAAGTVLVREAGGVVRSWPHISGKGPDGMLDCVAASPSMMPEILGALALAGDAYRQAGD